MKKILLSVVATCCFIMAPAQESAIPFQSHEAVITSVSSNGNWAVGSTMGVGFFVNSMTGKLTVFDKPETVYYHMNSVSNSGIAGGSYAPEYESNTPCYVTEEKGFVPLPTQEKTESGTCIGAPDDGSFLAGNMSVSGTDKNGDFFSYQKPVIWYRNSSGEYDVYEELPFSKIGFDKRRTQGAYILGVSGDGLRLFGRAIDGSGDVYLPVVWERSSVQSRDWVYKEYCSDFCFNKDKECPEYPQYKPIEPDAKEYYTEEELEAFNKALELYNDSVAKADWTIPAEERGPYPTYNPNEHEVDFFDVSTADGIERRDRYVAAYNEFVDAAVAYNDSIGIYYERFYEYIIPEKLFQIYDMVASCNGKYIVTTTASNIVLINAETEEVKIIEETEWLYPTAVLDNGTVFIGQKASIPPLYRIPSVYEDNAIIGFDEWVKKHSEKAYNDLITKFPDKYFGVVYSKNPEGITFGGFNQMLDYLYVGWVMNLAAYDDYTSGITENAISDNEIKIRSNSKEGYIDILGTDAADVSIFSINGSCVYKATSVSGRISVPSFAHGAYIVEVKDGKNVLREKVVFM